MNFCNGSLGQISWCLDAYYSLPLIVLGVGTLLLLLVEAFSSAKGGFPASAFAGTVLVASIAANLLVFEISAPELAFSGMLYVDQLAQAVNFLLLLGAVVCLLLGSSFLRSEKVNELGDYYSLYLLATLGAMVFANSGEFITMFLGLELMSMPLYCLCGSSLKSARGAESSLKYFFLGSFSSAFLLYGVALLYGLTGSTYLSEIAASLSYGAPPLAYLAAGLVLVGIVFKLAAVPFHFWAPDVYQGAPTPVTTYMSTVVKASAVVVAMRVLWTAFGESEQLLSVWTSAVWVMSVLTMVFGNLLAVQQRSLKRMLAYSSVAHAGYMMMALLAPGDGYGASAILFYILSYSIMTLGAFGVLMAVVGSKASEEGSDDITKLNRLGYRSPFLAAVMALFMFSLAGLPPGMAGLLGKFYVFNSAIRADFVGLAIIGVLGSAVSCFYYLRVVVAMYFVPAEGEEEPEVEATPLLTGTMLASFAALVIVLGLSPDGVYGFISELVNNSAALR